MPGPTKRLAEGEEGMPRDERSIETIDVTQKANMKWHNSKIASIDAQIATLQTQRTQAVAAREEDKAVLDAALGPE